MIGRWIDRELADHHRRSESGSATSRGIVKVEQPEALGGQRVASAISDGSWAVQEFVPVPPPRLPGNRNWFALDAFVETLRSAGVDVDALGL